MSQYNQQYHEHGGKAIPDGHCEFNDCKYHGLVNFTGDYMYLCDYHRKVMNATNFMRSKQGTAAYNLSKIKNLREQIVKLEAEQPALDEAAAKAEFKYKLIKDS